MNILMTKLSEAIYTKEYKIEHVANKNLYINQHFLSKSG